MHPPVLMVYPLAAMVLLTFIVGALALRARIGAVKAGVLRARYFKLFEGEAVPEAVVKTSRHFANVFEVPVLFYAVGVLFIALNQVNTLALILAWGFVAGRIAHAVIHIGRNHVGHRLIAFMAANLCVLGLWGVLVVRTF